MKLSPLPTLAKSLTLALALAAPTPTTTAQIRQILRLEPNTWLENLAVRSDGTLLATRLDRASVYLVDPRTGSHSTIATFPNVTSAFGIVEYSPDLFAVTTGNFSLDAILAGRPISSHPGTWSIQSIDLRPGLDKDGRAATRPLAYVDAAGTLNGLTFRAPSTLYSSDSTGGAIWAVDTVDGSVGGPFGDPLFQPDETVYGLGINGLKWDARRSQLLFGNSDRQLFGRVPVQGRDLRPAQQLVSGKGLGVTYDDFALDAAKGDVFMTTDPSNTVEFIAGDGGVQRTVAGTVNDQNSTTAGPTAAAFGRTVDDKGTLYVTTSGGLANRDHVGRGAQILALSF